MCQFFANMEQMATIMELVHLILSNGTVKELAKFFCIAWGLWGRRNKMIFEQCCIPPKQAIGNALAVKESFQQLNSIPVGPRLFESG